MLRFAVRNNDQNDFPRPEGMPAVLHRLLVQRGISSAAEAEAFLNPGPDSLLDPMRLSGMESAIRRIRGALAAGERICVYGDYDVDGVCASAILSGWLKSVGADARVYLPSRHSEGYGLNEGAIRSIAEWADLMVTVDCGVTGAPLVALAKQLGLDAIVTDHHRPAEDALPDCPVINPLLGDYPFPGLCGAGVAWKLVWALAGENAAMAWVDIAALATVADVVPLVGENRAIVRMGLNMIDRGARPGLAALIDAAGLSGKRITASNVAFQLAPRLNAGGRLGSAMRSFELLTETDPARAAEQADALNAENAARKSVEQQILRDAEAQLEGYDFTAHRALILCGKGWNAGVIGLAASRLVEKYNYPTVLLADQGEKMTGSCRSIEGVDIYQALTGCADTLVQFGGHRQAAGLTLLPERLEDFRAAMDAWLWAHTDPQDYVPICRYDAELEFKEVTPGLIAALEGLQPTGYGNPAPLFRASAQVVEARTAGADGAHLKLTLSQGGHRLGGIAFREGARAAELPDAVDALFVPKLNSYLGRTEPQLELKALADADVFDRLAAKLADEPQLQCEFLTKIFYNKKISPFSGTVTEVNQKVLKEWMTGNPQGTLVVTSDIACAGRLMRLLEPCTPDLFLRRLPGDPRAFNAICVCPAPAEAGRGYRRVVLAGVPSEWLQGQSGQIYRLPEQPEWLRRLPDIDAMRAVYRAVVRVARRPAYCRTMRQLLHLVEEESGIDEIAAAASILAMADMGLFRLELGERSISLSRSAQAKAEPGDSAVWTAMQRWRGGEL